MSRRNWWKRSWRRSTTSNPDVTAEALQEARKGTAAEHPALVVTPDRQAHAGAFVDGVFVEARGTGVSTRLPRDAEQHERDIAAGEVPGPNDRMEKKWWTGSAADTETSSEHPRRQER